MCSLELARLSLYMSEPSAGLGQAYELGDRRPQRERERESQALDCIGRSLSLAAAGRGLSERANEWESLATTATAVEKTGSRRKQHKAYNKLDGCATCANTWFCAKAKTLYTRALNKTPSFVMIFIEACATGIGTVSK